MPTTREITVFKDEILTQVGNDAILNPNHWLYEVSGFLAIKGKYSASGGLMAIGRSVNGWGNCGKFPYDLQYQEVRENFAEEVVRFIGVDVKCPMLNHWGNNNNRSSFGRVLRRVIRELEIPNFNEEEWPSYLVWSNLYKLSPHKGGNPNTELCDTQQTGCKNLLKVEFETYRPERVLFLTGYDWACPFLEDFTKNYSQMPEEINQTYVKQFGQLILPNQPQCKVVIACHPQTRPEDAWVCAVMKAFHILDDEAI